MRSRDGSLRRWHGIETAGFLAVLVTGLIMIASGLVGPDALEAIAYLVGIVVGWRASSVVSASVGERSCQTRR